MNLRPLARLPLLRRAYATAPSTSSTVDLANTPKPTKPLQESQPDSSDPVKLQQAPNYPETWSTSQNPKKAAYAGPRFEQINFALQPQPAAGIGMVQQDPVRLVDGRKASCDGGEQSIPSCLPARDADSRGVGGGPLGHPKIFINLDKPGPKACGYW